MSRILLSKLDIDVIVQLAVVGPTEADSWNALTKDPDELGTRLWARNYEVAAFEDDESLRPYVFEFLPIMITAAEGLNQLSYYGYQTDDEEHLWRRGGLGRTFDRLRAQLITALPDVASAPWGWGAADLAARSTRPRPSTDEPEEDPEEDPRIGAVVERYRKVGIELQGGASVGPTPPGIDDPRDAVGRWFYHPPGFTGFAPLRVFLAANERAARRHFLAVLAEEQPRRNWIESTVVRFGSEVLTLSWSARRPSYPSDFEPGTDDLLKASSRLGNPDERWTSSDPPTFIGTGEVMAQEVALAATEGLHSDSRLIVARTPKEVANLASMISDDELRELLTAVDTRSHTVVLLRGVPFVESIDEVVMNDTVVWETNLERASTLDIHCGHFSQAIGSLLLLDRLPQKPKRALLLSSEQGVQLLPAEPRISTSQG
jgi:hypothetical protein